MVINFKPNPLKLRRGVNLFFLISSFTLFYCSSLKGQDAIGFSYRTQKIQKSVFFQYSREVNSKNSIQLGLGVSLNPIVNKLVLFNNFDINYPIYFHEYFIVHADYIRFFKNKNEFKKVYFTSSLSYQHVAYRKPYEKVDDKLKLVLSNPMNTFQLETGLGLRLKTHRNFTFFIQANAGLFIRKAKEKKENSLFLSSQFGFNYALNQKQ